MTKVLVESEEMGPTLIDFTRTIKTIERMYGCESRIMKGSTVRDRDIRWCDVIVSVRSLSSLDCGIARLAKKQGKYHILLLDDDFLGLAGDYGLSGSGIWEKRKKALRKMLDLTNKICSVNRLLGEKYSNIGKVSSFCITNTIVEKESIVSPIEVDNYNRKLKVFYYVNDGTTDMFDTYIAPIMPQLRDRYKDSISLTFLTVKPDLSAYEKTMDIRYVGHMPFVEFRNFVADQHFDIGIAPLDGVGFSRYKYFNKFIEYSIGGALGIYSRCEPYTFVVQDEVNGILCGNTPEAWINAISRAIDNAELRLRCIKNAQDQIRRDFTAEKIARDLITDIPEMVTYSSPPSRMILGMIFVQLEYLVFRIREYMHFAAFHLNDEGLLLLLVRSLRYLKKLQKNKVMFHRAVRDR